MTAFKALVIPANGDEPVREVKFDNSNSNCLTGLVFGDEASQETVGMSSFLRHRIQMAYDDNGLFDREAVVNLRAMILYAALAGRTLRDFTSPLVGQYVILGVDPETGETADIPSQVATFFDEVVRDV